MSSTSQLANQASRWFPDQLRRRRAREQVEADVRAPRVLQEFRRLLSSLPSTGSLRGFRAPTRADLYAVGEYLLYWKAAYWEIILEGGVPGCSLFLHELSELQWYADNGLDPFDFRDQSRYYPQAHSQALITEHRFLELIARSEGLDFSLRDLIENNPHGDPTSSDWPGDWYIVFSVRGGEFYQCDLTLSVDPAEVQAFFEKRGFQALWYS